MSVAFALKDKLMSKMTPHDLQCPHCGNKQDTMVWDSINVTLDPDLKKKLYAAEINLFKCKKCNKETFINTPLLYHDMTQRFSVQYYPSQALENTAFFRQFNSDSSLSMFNFAAIGDSSAYLARPHIVFDMNEMIRYIAFRDGIAGPK